jgi:hypothetical protein
MLITAELYAFQCFLTLAKDSCWSNYDINVTVIDASNNQEVATVNLPKGKAWGRQSFSCQPAQEFFYQATYRPVFWQSEMGKIYKSIRYWSLPGVIGPKDTAWNIPVCYPADFATVPLPPDALGNCSCDWSSIPAPTPPPKA